MSDERLPRNARDIIDRLGPAVTLRLIRALGGTTIPVPMRLTPVGEARYKKLCDMIGEDAAKALCREYAGRPPPMNATRPLSGIGTQWPARDCLSVRS